MTSTGLYAIGTLSIWFGVAAALAWLVHVLQLLFGTVAAERSRLVGKVIGWGLAGAVGLFVGALLLSDGSGPRIPLAWFVMPFPAWAAIGCCVGFVWRGAHMFLALRIDERVERAMASLVWLLLGLVFLSLFLKSGQTIDILRGTIPVRVSTLVAMALFAAVAVLLMVLAGRRAKSRGWAKVIAIHLTLLAGSLIFGVPFVYLLVTSFKEDRDMVSPHGIIWIPKVQREVPYMSPRTPLYEGRFEGSTVQGEIIDKLQDGTVKVDIIKPMSIRGKTFVTKPSNLKEIPKMVPLVYATYQGRRVQGKVIDSKEDGTQIISVLMPSDLKDRVFEAQPSETEPIRDVGLRTENYTEALEFLPPETAKGLVYLKNSLILVIMNVVGTLLSSSIVAYAFSRLRFPGKKALFTLMLSTMMLPGAVTLLPQFLIFRNLGLIDTLGPLFIPAFFASALNVFLLRQFFMSIPMELEDASKIDGSSYLNTFWKVMMPQIKPALAVIAIWTFVGSWNNFMGPLIYINSPENMPVSYATQLYLGDRSSEPGLMMAFVTMSMIPILLLFFFAQKYFIEGVTLSGFGGR